MRQVGEVTYTDAHIRSGENRGEVRILYSEIFKLVLVMFSHYEIMFVAIKVLVIIPILCSVSVKLD